MFYRLVAPPVAKSTETPEAELRSRSVNVKQQQDRERPRSVSSQTTFDPINVRLSKSNENIFQSTSQKPPPFIEQQRGERITKSEDRHPISRTLTPLNDLHIQRFNLLKDKFDRQQPIDTVFGMKNFLHRLSRRLECDLQII